MNAILTNNNPRSMLAHYFQYKSKKTNNSSSNTNTNTNTNSNSRKRFTPIIYNKNKIPYSNYTSFTDSVKNDKITDVLIVPSKYAVKYIDEEGIQGISKLTMNDRLLESMEEHNVNISYDFQDANNNTTLTNISAFLPLIFPLILLYSIFQTARQSTRNGGGGGGGGMMNPFGNGAGNKFEFIQNTNVKFDDVAGIDGAKNEIMEIVEFLKNPQKFLDAGATIPKGCLLSGPPGTGKTLMAKAIAGEANVPFIACSASQFIELFVGIGASRIRELFNKARQNAPCIIFIDEIDAIGKARGNSLNTGGGNDEREQTLNQLLTEMDGFNNNNGVIVLAATNREDILDKALLRPGRFDRKISISLPSMEGRLKILNIHAKNKKIDSESSLELLAKKTIGCNGAELMNILNEASIYAARDGRSIIKVSDMDEAFDKITIGLPKGSFMSQDTKNIVAYHEAGHAILGALIQNFDRISKVSILPRGNTGGVTQFIPDEDLINNGMYTKDYLFNKIVVGLGGRIAEELEFGDKNITTGAVNDIQVVTSIAKTMIQKYGFSKNLGLRDIDNIDNVSNETKYLIDEEIAKIIDDAYIYGKQLMMKHKNELHTIAEELLDRETINGKEVYEILQ